MEDFHKKAVFLRITSLRSDCIVRVAKNKGLKYWHDLISFEALNGWGAFWGAMKAPPREFG